AGLQRADIHGDLLAAAHHFLASELGALEFLWCRVVILYRQSDFLARRHLDFGWLELVVLDYQSIGGILCRCACCCCENQGEREDGEARHRGCSGKLRTAANATKSHLYPAFAGGTSKIVLCYRGLANDPG